jgi:pescadillo protein
MAHLFGQMKQHGSINAERTRLCERYCREWLLVVVKTNALRKAFVTVKGYYYEAEVGGERVVWLVPHMFPHQKPNDVDVRIMSTFLEFYEVFLRFVLFKMCVGVIVVVVDVTFIHPVHSHRVASYVTSERCSPPE